WGRSLVGGEPKEPDRLCFVLRQAEAVLEHDAQIGLGGRVFLIRRDQVPAVRVCILLGGMERPAELERETGGGRKLARRFATGGDGALDLELLQPYAFDIGGLCGVVRLSRKVIAVLRRRKREGQVP